MNRLLPYLPHHIAAELIRAPAADPRRHARLDAVVLFADVSGFTPISEALGRHGQAGTEELTRLLNDYFEVMIDLVASYGGVVGAFGGDAMTALFPTAPGESLAAPGTRAVQCALDMQALMLPYRDIPTRAGSFSLTIKIGLAAGSVFSAVVGDPALRLQSLLAGAVVEQAVAAERTAHSGEVVLRRELAGMLPGLVIAEERGAFVAIADLLERPSYTPLPELPAAPAGLLPTLSAFLHPAVARRLLDDRSGFVNEYRDITALFVGFDGFDYDGDSLAHAHMQDYLARVGRVVQQYDGDLNKLDMADKGNKFVILFGAPVAHENDAERAMHCALALRALHQEIGHGLRVGIASGLVFCGLVGGALRREYTVMGDTVNLAARLMQAARPGEIVVASGSQRRVAGAFAWERAEPQSVKGRSRPVTVYRLLGARQRGSRHQEPAYKLPMVGRDEELRAIEARLDLALAGQGQVLGVCAEAGMGKSRLLAEVIRSAARRGLRVLNGECLSHGGSVGYLPWHNLLRGLFEIDPAWDQETQLRQLHDWLALNAPQLLARLPLLAVALNLPIVETDLTRSLDARTRKEVLESTVVECLRAVTARQAGAKGHALGAPQGSQSSAPDPATAADEQNAWLLVIEDCHWIDSLSHDLLEAVARGVADRPVLILLAYRPPEHAHDRLRVTRLPNFLELRLREFSLRETEWLIGLKFGYLFGARGVLPASFVERITERSQGNPFYIDQMINYIQDQGISPDDAAALERLRLPDSLRSLIISRIDRLSEQEQITLKVASVLGRVFRASWLWGIYPQLGRPEQVRAHLDVLSQLELTPMERDEPELEYLFKHVVTQEVAYESLALATRAMLHEQAGRFIEEHFADDLSRYLDMLAYHFGRSENVERQRHYFRLAGEAAQAAYANDIALGYYLRLLPLLEPAEQIGVRLRLGAVLQLVGRWAEAGEQIYAALAAALAGGDSTTVARCRTELAHLLAARGDYDAAITIIDQVMPVWERQDDPAGHYEALWVLGSVLTDIGEYTRGLRQLEHTHEIAVRLGNERLMARSVGSMGLVYVDIGDYEMALYCLERAAAMALRFGDWTLLARARGGAGFVQLCQNGPSAALGIFHELLLRAAEIGDRRFLARFARQIGRCHQLAGDPETALGCYAVQIGVGPELGERRDTSIGLGYLAAAYAQLGDEEQAERLGELAIALCDSIRLVYWACEFRHDLAGLRFRQGRYAEAAELNDAALATARRLGSHKSLQLRAELLAARLRVIQGEQPAAAAADELRAIDDEWLGAPEQAALAYTIWQLDPSEQSRRAAAARYASLAATTLTVESRRRHAELGGDPLPPPDLPAPPAALSNLRYDLDSLLAQAEGLLAAAV